MRTTTYVRPRAIAFLPFFVLLVAVGCDGSLIASEAAGPLEAPTTERGDVLYRLAPLGAGDTFAAELLLEDGSSITLSTEGIGNGLARTQLDPGALRLDSVTVEYISDGVETAPARTIDYTGFFFKGGDDGDTSEDPPSSYHWEYVDGKYILVQDYTATEPGSDSKQAS